MPGCRQSGQEAGNRTETVQKITMALNSDGAVLKGSVVTGGPRRDNTAEIKDGKIEGSQIRFVTVIQ